MRTIFLIGTLFLVAGLFTFTRGPGWQVSYMAAGSILILIGIVVLAPTDSTPHGETKAVTTKRSRLLPRRRSTRVPSSGA